MTAETADAPERCSLRMGFIGLGQQGKPMAARLLAAGYPLTVWARRPEAAQDLVDSGASIAKSIAELGARCDHVAICVVDDQGVIEVCAELIPAMQPGSILVLHSTVLPQTCREVEDRCAARDIHFLDAPVSGGGPAAAAGKLTIMCGGTATAFAKALPVLKAFAEAVVHLGAAGSGQQAKIVNNALMAASMGLAHAALAAGEQLGIERSSLAELIKISSGRSFGFEVYARLPQPSAFAHGAPLLDKDVTLLGAILADSPQTRLLQATAAHFLDEART